MTSAQRSDGHRQAPIVLDGSSLSLEEVVAVARHSAQVRLADGAMDRVRKARAWIDEIGQDDHILIYGVNTGFGPLANVHIPSDKMGDLTRNLILSHSVGIGPPLTQEAVRATLLIRANTLAKGYSGIRCQTLETLVDMLNRGVHPVVPEKGSVGASGDLAPLSHLALPLIGEGEAYFGGERLAGGDAMRRAGLSPVRLGAKEGLALNNGTTVMAALGCLALVDAQNLVDHAEIALAMSLEALLGASRAYDARLHAVRNHLGQQETAANVRRLIAGSELINATQRVQDAYSLRCGPQVLGSVRDTLAFVRTTLHSEINAATDNPLIFLDEPGPNKAFSGGNFHGEPLALALDFLGIAVAEVGSIAERRIFRLLDGTLSCGLPSMLTTESGLQSGLMLTQYTAAALVSDNKTLAHPDSVDSIPTGANQEDHVSMGTNAARHTREIIWNCERIIAIEFLCAAQALDYRLSCAGTDQQGTRMDGESVPKEAGSGGQSLGIPPRLGTGTAASHQALRADGVLPLTEDRSLAADIEQVASLIHCQQISSAVQEALDNGKFTAATEERE
ncbi:histidine ammonia-lyase [Chloroflexota bacterium]